ncbi:MAG: hypothetical protein GC160_15025 [Acidobacteria bacterium]|nr:hypothetical protein [Acidobacteriota bacterium]
MRRSITTPLLIILLGCLLLARNLLDDFSVWELFAQEWPWLLVAAGVLRLAEHALAAARDEPGPGPLGGGALVLAFLLCCVGSLAHAVDRAVSAEGFGVHWADFGWFDRTHDIPVEGTWPAADVKTLRIEGFHGDLEIVGDGEDSIRLSGSRRVNDSTLERARAASEAQPIRARREGDALELRLQGHSARRFAGDLTVHAPRALALALSEGRGELRVRDFDAPVSIKTDGEVELERVAGAVELELEHGRRVVAEGLGGALTVRGSTREIKVRDAAGPVSIGGKLFGEIEIAEVADLQIRDRRLTLKAPGRVSGQVVLDGNDLSLEGLDGGVELEANGRWEIAAKGLGGPAKLQGQRGSIEVLLDATPPASLTARLDEGEIHAELPAGGDYQLEARGAHVDSDLPDLAGEPDRDLRLVRGGGSAKIVLDAGRGRVRINALP